MLKQARIIGNEDEMRDEGAGDEVFELLKFVWNVDVYKQTLHDY